MSTIRKISAVSVVATIALCTPASALDLGLGGGVSVGGGGGINVGGGGGVSVGGGGVSARGGGGLSVGGGSVGVGAGADVSVGGGGIAAGAGVGVGGGVDTPSPGTPGTPGTPGAKPGTPGTTFATTGSQVVPPVYMLDGLVGTMVISSDGKAIGHITETNVSTAGKVMLRVRLIDGLSSKSSHVDIAMNRAPRGGDIVRLGMRLDSFLRRL